MIQKDYDKISNVKEKLITTSTDSKERFYLNDTFDISSKGPPSGGNL